jgi:hypothetical protein
VWLGRQKPIRIVYVCDEGTDAGAFQGFRPSDVR